MDTREENLFSVQLRKSRKAFSKSECRIIDYIAANSHEVIHLTLAELAERTGTSDVTIIRFCKKIDLSGFPELKIVIAQSFSPLSKTYIENVEPSDSVEMVVRKEFRNAINALESTLGFLRIKNVEAAADALISAKRILIFGKGDSAAVAMNLQHELLRLGLPSEMYADSHSQHVAVANLKPADVVFVISHAGATKYIIDAMKIAKDKGAKVVTLTNYARSPVYDISDIRLYTAFKEGGEFSRPPRIPEFMIVDVLCRIIAHKNHEYANDVYSNVKRALIEEG